MPGGSILPKWFLTGGRRFLFLLIFLLVFIFLGPFLTKDDGSLSLYDGLFTGVLILGAYSASQRKAFLAIALAILVPAVALLWLDHFDPSASFAVPRYMLTILFLTFIGGTILAHVLRAERVSLDKICAALCSYLLIGLIWAILYALLELLEPGTFLTAGQVIPQGEAAAFQGTGLGLAIYFSFTTLTTLGYGDITATTPLARNLCVLEALIGQIYLVVLVARLVGMEISHGADKKSS